ncbi:MAG: helix-turn-helix domain-containing protein [Syntrophales bacterium]
MARIVKPKELAEFLRLTHETVCKLAAEGKLPGFKIGRSWRFDLDEVLKRINEAKADRSGKHRREPE